MPDSVSTRREFLAQAGGAWLAMQLPLLSTLAACARDAAERGQPLTTLTAAEGRAFTAFAARIIPTDDTPGATEAGAVHFADHALAGPFAGMLEPVRAGLAELDATADREHGTRFDELADDEQDAIISALEEAGSPFFFSARMLTILGVFADPSYGGNRNGAGHAVLGIEHPQAFQPPFGHYDAEYAGRGGA